MAIGLMSLEDLKMTALMGIDISNNNPGVDMQGARMQGVTFVTAKCSQGWAGGPGGWMDWCFVDIVTRARTAGLMAGGYHWLLRGNGAAQAQQFIASLARVGGPKGLLCAVDIERNDWNQALNADPQTVDDFLAEWDRATNHQPILLYGASWYHDGYMNAGARWSNRPLWVAQYTGVRPQIIGQSVDSVTPGYFTPFGGWTSYALRQFTDNVTVPAQGGGTMQVDGNVTYLTLPQLQAMTAPPVPTGGPPVTDAQYQTLLTTMQQLVTVFQGIPAGKPNPFNIVGNRDLKAELDVLKAELEAIKAKVGA